MVRATCNNKLSMTWNSSHHQEPCFRPFGVRIPLHRPLCLDVSTRNSVNLRSLAGKKCGMINTEIIYLDQRDDITKGDFEINISP